MARPCFNPTAEHRRLVEALAGYGVAEDEVAQNVGINPKTLRKHFRRELDLGATKAKAQVAQSAFKMATSGRYPAMTMFWLKCRAGWRETTILQHTGPQGGPMEISHEHIDKRITDELARLAAAPGVAGIPGEVEAGREAGVVVPVAGMEGTREPTGTGG